VPRLKLTDRGVQAIKPPASGQVDYFDERLSGFALRVSATGRKAWVVMYRHAGRLRRLTLKRPYPALGLADAREEAEKLLARVALGEDPAAQRRSAQDAPTFGDVVREYLERHAKPRKRSWREDERILRVYVPAAWRGMKAHAITRRDVRELIADLAERTPIMANRVFACVRKVFNFAVRWDLVPASPCVGIERPAAERQRDRVLTADELRRLWAALGGVGSLGTILKLMLYTAQRGGEVKTLAWTDLDLDGGWWTIPAEKAKNGLAHRVPLSAPAIALLRELRDGANGSPWVFASVGKSGHVETLKSALDRVRRATGERCGECAGCATGARCRAPRNVVEFVPHDLRRTVATFLTSELGVSRLVVSKLLNHVEMGVTKVYDRASYDREKAAALNAWAARLEAIVSGEAAMAKVLPLARA
jgi:integrase